MNCEDVRALIDAFIDHELSPGDRRLLEGHAEGCDKCRALIDQADELSALVRSAPKFSSPPELRSSIIEELDGIDDQSKNHYRQSLPLRLATHAGAVAAGALMALIVSQFVLHQKQWTDELVVTHLRHSAAQQFGTVASADRHIIRPWFTGKIDYAPPVIDLSEEGFPLLSGRVEYISGRAVAALTYARRLHQISLFILPSAAGSTLALPSMPLPAKSSRGLHITHWKKGEFFYAAVSDVNSRDLSAFAGLIRKRLEKD